jgi:hypothetical protein
MRCTMNAGRNRSLSIDGVFAHWSVLDHTRRVDPSARRDPRTDLDERHDGYDGRMCIPRRPGRWVSAASLNSRDARTWFGAKRGPPKSRSNVASRTAPRLTRVLSARRDGHRPCLSSFPTQLDRRSCASTAREPSFPWVDQPASCFASPALPAPRSSERGQRHRAAAAATCDGSAPICPPQSP